MPWRAKIKSNFQFYSLKSLIQLLGLTISTTIFCTRHFEALTAYFARYTRSFNWMIMLGFFTNTALHRLFTMQMTTPGTAKTTTVFIMSLKQDLPEVSHINII